MLNAGFAERDITPPVGLTLSGFGSRCDRPSTGVDDPLAVRALTTEADGERTVLLSFDLLGLGRELVEQIQRRLDAVFGDRIPRPRRLLCATHTHSGPSTITLRGCGIPDAAYWRQLVQATAEAAEEAEQRMTPVRLSRAELALPGCVYNRRQILADGRVTMSPRPDGPVIKTGPVRDRMLLVRFESHRGEPVAGIIHWAAHPITVCSQHVSADYPGRLCHEMSERFGMPFLFLQGASANLNVPFEVMSRAQMLHNVEQIMARATDVEWTEPADVHQVGFAHATLPLRYAPLPTAPELTEFAAGMEQIARTGRGPQRTIAVLMDIMNARPGEALDAALTRHLAGTLGDWARDWLARRSTGGEPTPCSLELAAWRVGSVCWCFAAAEVFAETAIALEAGAPRGEITAIVGCSSPLVGYLPTDEAMDEGGYEVNDAYRFYDHPAPFERGSEPRVVQALGRLAAQTRTRAYSR